MPKSEKTTKLAPAEAGNGQPAPKPEKRHGRPPKGEDRIPKVMSFFKRVDSIAKEDWGTRAAIKVYRLEPSIDRLRLGEPKHIQRYTEPVDEDRIKADHGSGRYRLYLNFKVPTEQSERELDSMEIDILDMNFPPKLARGEWLDIPANKKWEWCRNLLPATPGQQQEQRATATQELAETLSVLDSIQDRALERAQPAAQRVDSTLDIIRAVKELTPAPPPATDNALLNTVVTLMQTQIQVARDDNKELRKEIQDMRNGPQKAGGALGTLKEIVTEAKSLWPDLKEMFPNLGQRIAGGMRAPRSNMSADQEFFQPIVTRILDGIAPVVPMLVTRLMTPNAPTGFQSPPAPAIAPANGTAPAASPAQPNAPANGAAPAPDVPPFNPQQAFEFLKQHAKPFVDSFKDGMSGIDFAERLFDLYGGEWQGLSWLYAKQAFGADAIVGLFEKSPFWPEIAAMKEEFQKYVGEFVAWQPGQEEPEPQGKTVNTSVVEEAN